MLADSIAITAAPQREQIDAVEQVLLTLPQREIETVQWLHAGLLYRQISIPADTFATGAVQLGDHVSVMVSGTMQVSTDRGMELVSGFRAWPGRAGIKRIGYAFTPTVWLTVHRTDAQTVDQAERELFGNADMLLSNRPALGMAA